MEALRIGSTKPFLMDGTIVEDVWMLRRMQCPVKKHEANPVMRRTHEYEGCGPYLHGTVLRDPDTGQFRMWYQSFRYLEDGVHYTYDVHYAVSSDGIHWEKPALGIVEHLGSGTTNVCMKGHSRIGAPCILHEPDDPDPKRRYKMVYLDALRGQWDGICVAFSEDGIHWESHPGNPVIPGHSDTHNNALWDPKRREYVLFMRPNVYAGPNKRRIARAVSPDFTTWEETGVVLVPDEADPLLFYGMTAFLYEGMYYGLVQAYYQDTQAIDIVLCFSRDGVHWNRLLDRRPFIPLGFPGHFDCGMICDTATAPVIVGDEMWFYYTGWDGPHDARERDAAIGLGTVRLDRIMGWYAHKEPGMLLTRPFVVEGDELEINARTYPKGSITVAVLDERGQELEGYGADDGIPYEGDEVRHRFVWRGGRSLGALRGRIVRLRFVITLGEFYAFRMI